MYLLIIYLPFLSFIILGLFGRFLGYRGSLYFAAVCILFANLLSYIICYEVCICDTTSIIHLATWINFDIMQLDFGFYFDTLTSIMLVVVTFISLVAHIYSVEYMNNDPHRIRFICYLSLFTFFMLLLVTAHNLVQLFIGWEGVGICSYLLINFWFSRIQANKSAILAVVVNKISDLALLCAFAAIFYYNKSFDITVLSGVATLFSDCFINSDIFYIMHYWVCLLFIIGAVGKSAQIGLHIWLPEAMEGPTPVSSLIHAATMVTAGIFLLCRFRFFYTFFPELLVLIVLIGALTAFFGATVGIFVTDLKKVIAYSTCSQLGYMFFACGLLQFSSAMYHLFIHAFFKALLFLCAGYLIHACHEEQDLRKYGGLYKILPSQYVMVSVGSISLMGLPFFSGFFSKERIVESIYGYSAFINIGIYNYIYFAEFLVSIVVICSVIYSMRLLAYVFFNSFGGFRQHIMNIHYASVITIFALAILAIASICCGYITEIFFYDYALFG